jgi:hypothetical protein
VYLHISIKIYYFYFYFAGYPPAKTFFDPVATLVHPAIRSPTLPHPLPFTKTDLLPTAIGAVWEGHGLPGSKCTEL